MSVGNELTICLEETTIDEIVTFNSCKREAELITMKMSQPLAKDSYDQKLD